MFLRHFGCHNCRDHAVQLRDRYDDLQRAGHRPRRDRHRRPALRRRVRPRREDPVPRAGRRRREGGPRPRRSTSRRGTASCTPPRGRHRSRRGSAGARIHKAGQARDPARRDLRARAGRSGALQPRRRRQHRPRARSRDPRRGRESEHRAECKAVIFDFYGTLAETPDWGPSWQKMVAERRLRASRRRPRPLVERRPRRHRARRALAVSRDHYVAWQQSRVRGMLADCGVPSDDPGRVDRARARDRRAPQHARVRRSRPTVLARAPRPRAHARDLLQLGLGSRRGDRSRRARPAPSTSIVSSAWVGARKPHRRMYDAVLERAGVAPDDALFVGDTWSCDVEGPRAAGLRPVYVRRPHLGPDATAPDDHHDARRAPRHRPARRARPGLTAQLTARSWPAQ